MPEGDEEDDPEDSGESRTRVLPATEFPRTVALYQSEDIDELIGALRGHPRHSPVRDLFTIHSVVTPATVDLDSILVPSAGGAIWSANLLADDSYVISVGGGDGGGPSVMVGRQGRRLADVAAEDRFLGHFDLQRTSELGSASNTSRPRQLSAGFSSAFLESSSSGGPPGLRRQMSESGRASKPPNQRSSLGRLRIHEETSLPGTCSGEDGETADQHSARSAVHREVVAADTEAGASGGGTLLKKNNTEKTVMVGLKWRIR